MMFAPTRAALTATASACLALRPATVVVVGVGARCLSSAAVATTTTTTTTSSSTSGSASSNTSPLLARARVPPSLPNTAPTRRRALHTTPAVLFDAHSLDATAGEEGARVGAVLTAFRRPGLGDGDGDGDGWRGRDPTIVLTRRAVERLQAIAGSSTSSPGPAGEGREERLALRLAVEPGGCHGYQYKIELVDEADEDDFHFQPPPPRNQSQTSHQPPPPLPILIDSTSLQLLQGATLDFVTELIGSQFAVRENPQAKGGGCGCGVSWEPAV